MTPRDLARIGLMMLKGGMWHDRRVVPVDWIERSTSPMVEVDEIRQYGYHWCLGKFAFTVSTGPRWEPVAARGLLECDRQWRPAALCLSRPSIWSSP
jgi:CubicO group peptidase (beta-lactamase class C family)